MKARLEPVARVVVALVVTGVVYGVVFSYRTDYLGHYLGGFGGTLLLLSPITVARGRSRHWLIVAVTAVAIGIGFGTESTIFELAIFDPVDFCNQSLGAVIAAAAVLRDRARVPVAAGLVGIALVVMIGGFYFAFL